MLKEYGIIVSSTVPSGPASTLTYTIRLNTAQGGTVVLSGIVPSTNRPPEEMDTKAAKPGTVVERIEIGPNDYAYLFQEYPDWADCE